MTDLRTAAQQALEALEDYKRSDDDRVSIAMHILCTALAEPNTEHSSAVEPVQEPDSPERRCGGPGCDMRCCQPVQEPRTIRMERVDRSTSQHWWSEAARIRMPSPELYAAGDTVLCWVNEGDMVRAAQPKAAPAQEPVEWSHINGTSDTKWQPQRPAEPVQEPQGCDHCNHPLYAATKCRVCGRAHGIGGEG